MTAVLLSKERLNELDKSIGSSADRWLKRRLAKRKRVTVQPKLNVGRKEVVIANPFCGYAFDVEAVDDWGTSQRSWRAERNALYPRWAIDVLVGVSRMPWYGREDGPSLSVKKMVGLLGKLENVSSRRVQIYLQLGEDQSQRYASALQIAIPRLMACRPMWLIKRMDNGAEQSDGLKLDHAPWEDKLEPPPPDVLEALQRAMATFPDHELHDEEYQAELEFGARPIELSISYEPPALLSKPDHPKKAEVMVLLGEGKSIREIVRLTGVSNTTVQRWKNLKATED